jgi:hypothetical protein
MWAIPPFLEISPTVVEGGRHLMGVPIPVNETIDGSAAEWAVVRAHRVAGNKKPAGAEGSGGSGVAVESRLDRRADLRQDRADLRPEEDQGDDRNDGDEREDQRVLRETLAFLVPTSEARNC